MANLRTETFKTIQTLDDLKKIVDRLVQAGLGKEKVFMFNDEEGNETNKILYLELYKDGLIFVPHEYWERG